MILPFDMSFWDFEEIPEYKRREDESIREKRERNTRKFVYWTFDLLDRTAPRKLENDEVYTSVGIYMSRGNTEYLHQHIDPWSYLCYSPVDVEMPDDQMEIKKWFTVRV